MEGEILKRLIKESGETQESFASRLGISSARLATMFKEAVISPKYKVRIIQLLALKNDPFSRENVEKVQVSKTELERLWDIINAQQRLIDSLQKDKE